jgi:hypothetical protein
LLARDACHDDAKDEVSATGARYSPTSGIPKRSTSERADAELERGVDATGANAGRYPRHEETAQTHTAHEGAEQRAHGHGRGSDRELKEVKPDDFVDQGGRAAPDQQKEGRPAEADRP